MYYSSPPSYPSPPTTSPPKLPLPPKLLHILIPSVGCEFHDMFRLLFLRLRTPSPAGIATCLNILHNLTLHHDESLVQVDGKNVGKDQL